MFGWAFPEIANLLRWDSLSHNTPVMPGLDPGIHAVRALTSAPLSHRLVLHALSPRSSDAVDGRIKSGDDVMA